MKGARIYVVEDNDALRRGVVRALRDAGAEVESAARGDEAIARLKQTDRPSFEVILTDLRLPGATGLEVLEAVAEQEARAQVVMMTAHGSIDCAVDAMRQGAFDFIAKPFELEHLEMRLQRAVEHRRLVGEVSHYREERARRFSREGLVGESRAMREAIALASRVANSPSTVLVTGETGTGKELIAGLIHGASPRAQGPFVKVNCAALPETLLESELFGHERGAYTGADRMRLGRFEQANGGTLFLDEIGDLAPTTQAKLLRVLQEREFHRLGGTRAIRVDVRIVAATNQRLESQIGAGRFREDLFFRLNVIRIELPPLRERDDDVVILAEHYLERFTAELGYPHRPLSDVARETLRTYAWPGNVRELRNAMERAVLLADGEEIDEIELDGVRLAAAPLSNARERRRVAMRLDDTLKAAVLEALEENAWVQKEAARSLGISRRKLNYMIRQMGITHATWRRNREGDRETT